MSGWFSCKRGITSHPLFKGHPERLAIWIWLLDNVAWKDTKTDVNGKTVDVPRGSVSASERRIADETGVGYQVVRTFMARLQTEHMVNARLTHGRKLFSLVNWDRYQRPELVPNAGSNAGPTQDQRTKETREQDNPQKTVRDEPLGSLSDADAPATNVVKLPVRKPEAKPAHPKPDPMAAFPEFWDEAYPHRGGAKRKRARAEKAWRKAVTSGTSADVILAAARAYHADRGVLDGFAPDPSSWLNDRGWENDIEPAGHGRISAPDHPDHLKAICDQAMSEVLKEFSR